MNYWIHRISHHADLSYPLLDNGYLTIGYSDFVDDEIIEKVRSNDCDVYLNERFKEKWGIISRKRVNLSNFLNMHRGDIVIVPTSGAFCVCLIQGALPIKINEVFISGLKNWNNQLILKNKDRLIKENGQEYDLGFAWKVEVLYKNISRDKFADAKLTARMKIRQTNANINDLSGNVEKSIESYKENKPINLYPIVIDDFSKSLLTSIRLNLNPSKFEILVKDYFQKIGGDKIIIPPKKERDKSGDADVIAVFENLKLIIYVQVKFHHSKTDDFGVEQVRDYKMNKESVDDGYNKIAWVISTSDSFEQSAQYLASENKIQLINGIEFSRMLLSAGIDLFNRCL